jgi:hypothetical protein
MYTLHCPLCGYLINFINNKESGFDVLSTVVTNESIFWVIKPYSQFKVSRSFGGTNCLNLQGRIAHVRNQRESTRRSIPQGRTHRCFNLLRPRGMKWRYISKAPVLEIQDSNLGQNTTYSKVSSFFSWVLPHKFPNSAKIDPLKTDRWIKLLMAFASTVIPDFSLLSIRD